MTQYKEVIHNIATGEITERPYTEEELAAVAEVEAKVKAEREALAAAEAAKAHERAALLERLGITQDEARLLLGGN